MKKYSHILFDLDGTLTDPYEGITKSARYALQRFGITENDEVLLRSFIGPPLRENFSKMYNLSTEDCEKAVVYYRERFGTIGMYENRVYEGVPQMLHTLRDKGYTLALASSKAEFYVKIIIEHFGLSEFFTFVGGAEMDGRRSDKAEVIEYVLHNLGVSDKANSIMVGDRKHDLIGAKKAGIDSLGVLWGYGSKEELSLCENVGLLESPSGVVKFFG